MSDPLHIRQASAGDLDTIVAFNIALAAESENKTLDEPTVRAGVRTALERSHLNPYYLAEIDGVVVGQAQVTYEWSDWRNAWFWWFQSVYVHLDHRRSGVFRALYEHIKSEARRRGDVCGLRLYVERSNEPAINTYMALGMIAPNYVLMEDDWANSGNG